LTKKSPNPADSTQQSLDFGSSLVVLPVRKESGLRTNLSSRKRKPSPLAGNSDTKASKLELVEDTVSLFYVCLKVHSPQNSFDLAGQNPTPKSFHHGSAPTTTSRDSQRNFGIRHPSLVAWLIYGSSLLNAQHEKRNPGAVEALFNFLFLRISARCHFLWKTLLITLIARLIYGLPRLTADLCKICVLVILALSFSAISAVFCGSGFVSS
jgi:hypothetical protein